MDDFPKKRRDTSRFDAERFVVLTLRPLLPSIAACNDRIARCRAIATLGKAGYLEGVSDECRSLRAELSRLRDELRRATARLSMEQLASSRVRDMGLALDKLEMAIEDILRVAGRPLNEAPTADNFSGYGRAGRT